MSPPARARHGRPDRSARRGRGGWRTGAALGVAVLLCGASQWGCNDYVHRARTAYRDGRYLEVAEDLARHEREVDGLSSPQRAQYGLYRGLSLLQLGDFEGARRWLDFTYEVERDAPGSLAPGLRLELDKAWRLLEELTGMQSYPEPDEPAPGSSFPEDGPAPPWPDDEDRFGPAE